MLPYPWRNLVLRPLQCSPLPPSSRRKTIELTGGMALDFDLRVHTVGLLTAGGGMALHLSPGGALGLLILGKGDRGRRLSSDRELLASSFEIWALAT